MNDEPRSEKKIGNHICTVEQIRTIGGAPMYLDVHMHGPLSNMGGHHWWWAIMDKAQGKQVAESLEYLAAEIRKQCENLKTHNGDESP